MVSRLSLRERLALVEQKPTIPFAERKERSFLTPRHTHDSSAAFASRPEFPLRGAGVALCLPWLESLGGIVHAAEAGKSRAARRRLPAAGHLPGFAHSEAIRNQL